MTVRFEHACAVRALRAQSVALALLGRAVGPVCARVSPVLGMHSAKRRARRCVVLFYLRGSGNNDTAGGGCTPCRVARCQRPAACSSAAGPSSCLCPRAVGRPWACSSGRAVVRSLCSCRWRRERWIGRVWERGGEAKRRRGVSQGSSLERRGRGSLEGALAKSERDP